MIHHPKVSTYNLASRTLPAKNMFFHTCQDVVSANACFIFPMLPDGWWLHVNRWCLSATPRMTPPQYYAAKKNSHENSHWAVRFSHWRRTTGTFTVEYYLMMTTHQLLVWHPPPVCFESYLPSLVAEISISIVDITSAGSLGRILFSMGFDCLPK